MKHDNSGACAHCLEILNKYPKFDEDLLEWFKSTQKTTPNFHAAEGGRGREAQETDFTHGASKAHYGESAHNFNAALDGFFIVKGKYNLDEELFRQVAIGLPSFIEWYGAVGAKFYERPHFEKCGWRELADAGLISLVEE